MQRSKETKFKPGQLVRVKETTGTLATFKDKTSYKSGGLVYETDVLIAVELSKFVHLDDPYDCVFVFGPRGVTGWILAAYLEPV